MKPRFRCHPCTFRHVDGHRLPDPHLTHRVRLFPRRSPQRSSANAAVGGLKPPPAGRLRRAYLHLPRSTASRSSTYRKPPSAFVTHHSHTSWLLKVRHLCPFALWSGSPGLQIGRALLLVGWAAQRGPVSHMDAGLFCAASLRTRRARFPAPGSPAIYAARATGFAWIQSFPAALAENVKYHFGFCIAHPSWFPHRSSPVPLRPVDRH
jgi:hypothetical protein